MSYMSDPMGYALDMHITGHYGEDQFRGEEEFEELCDYSWSICIFEKLNQCPIRCLCDESCAVVKAVMEDYENKQRELDDEMEQCWIDEQEERARHPELF
jgi:hypothetical protein